MRREKPWWRRPPVRSRWEPDYPDAPDATEEEEAAIAAMEAEQEEAERNQTPREGV